MNEWQRLRLRRGPGPLRPVEAAGVRESASVGRFQEFAAAFDAAGDCSRARRRNPPRSFDREAHCRGIGRLDGRARPRPGLAAKRPRPFCKVSAYDSGEDHPQQSAQRRLMSPQPSSPDVVRNAKVGGLRRLSSCARRWRIPRRGDCYEHLGEGEASR